jgi:hypothetical protein
VGRHKGGGVETFSVACILELCAKGIEFLLLFRSQVAWMSVCSQLAVDLRGQRCTQGQHKGLFEDSRVLRSEHVSP